MKEQLLSRRQFLGLAATTTLALFGETACSPGRQLTSPYSNDETEQPWNNVDAFSITSECNQASHQQNTEESINSMCQHLMYFYLSSYGMETQEAWSKSFNIVEDTLGICAKDSDACVFKYGTENYTAIKQSVLANPLDSEKVKTLINIVGHEAGHMNRKNSTYTQAQLIDFGVIGDITATDMQGFAINGDFDRLTHNFFRRKGDGKSFTISPIEEDNAEFSKTSPLAILQEHGLQYANKCLYSEFATSLEHRRIRNSSSTELELWTDLWNQLSTEIDLTKMHYNHQVIELFEITADLVLKKNTTSEKSSQNLSEGDKRALGLITLTAGIYNIHSLVRPMVKQTQGFIESLIINELNEEVLAERAETLEYALNN